jgi:uncharacterized protein
MPADWTRAEPVERLAEAGAHREVHAQITDFPRLQGSLGGAAAGEAYTGDVHGSVDFAHEGGRYIARVTVRADVPLVCQRCLQPMRAAVDASSVVRLVDAPSGVEGAEAGADAGDSAEVEAAAEDETELVMAAGGRISIRDLIEEELLLGLPLVARHEDSDVCAAAAAQEQQDRQTPFAALRQLLAKKD